MIETTTPFWPNDWLDPSKQRNEKPRTKGLTMVIDKGLGPKSFCDLVDTAAPYIDICKLGFGTSALYPASLLQEKIKKALEQQILIMPGGTFFEVVCQHQTIDEYLAFVKKIGFTAVELSDGTFDLSKTQRELAIHKASKSGLVVCTEYGKKAACFTAELEGLVSTVERDLKAGADYVIIEARESGNVGVFNRNGELDVAFIHEVIKTIGPSSNRLIWEAPRKEQQVALLHSLGLQANLGNIAPDDVLSVEALRRGLRADTSASVMKGRL